MDFINKSNNNAVSNLKRYYVYLIKCIHLRLKVNYRREK